MNNVRCYTELERLKTFKERFLYLQLSGFIGEETFGFDRWINQKFYKSSEWKKVRDLVIIRDNGCDLGIDGHTINGKILIHHMNPISLQDIESHSDYLLNPEYMISTTHSTHNAIHYGNESYLIPDPIIRAPNDTCPWKK